jgi:hypothetical protein
MTMTRRQDQTLGRIIEIPMRRFLNIPGCVAALQSGACRWNGTRVDLGSSPHSAYYSPFSKLIRLVDLCFFSLYVTFEDFTARMLATVAATLGR